MRVVVKFFSSYKEAVGASKAELDVEDGITVGALVEKLKGDNPNLAKLTDEIVVSVNLEYSLFDKVLTEGDEIALLPPVSGG
jgi:molybdopterin converting factor subunit 1